MNRLGKRNPTNSYRPLPSPSSSSSSSPSRPVVQTTTSYGAGLVVRNSAAVASSSSSRSPATTTAPSSVEPRSAVEQYWAARALTAEALLSARSDHHRELQSASYTHDVRRSRDLAALSKIHEAMQAKMEKLVMGLLACLVFMVVLVAYLLATTSRRRPPSGDKHVSRWRLPAHFTIPILSPFTSVIEHETSVVGTQTIAISLVVLAALGYAVFRHWLHSGVRSGAMRT